MLNRLVAAFRATPDPDLPPPVPALATVAPKHVGPTYDSQPIPSYPERSPLVPAMPPQALLEPHAELIGRLRQALGLGREDFARWVQPVLDRYAARVHLLPASQSDHHCGRGGLLRHGLESAFFAARLSEGRVFGLEVEPEYRKALEPKWRLAVVFAALMHDMGKAIIDVNAVSEDGDLVWNGHGVDLWSWLQRHQLSSYYIQWNPGRRDGRHMLFGGMLVRELLGVQLIEHLSAGEAREVMDKLVLSFTQPSVKAGNLVAALASQAEQESVEFDLEDQAQRAIAAGGTPDRSNGHLMLRSLKRQVEAGDLAFNVSGAPLWLTQDGLFGLVPDIWRLALDPLLREGRVKGVPRENAHLTDLMLHHRLILPTPDGKPIWPLTVVVGDIQMDLPTVRFAAASLLLEDRQVAPITASIRSTASPAATQAPGHPVAEPAVSAATDVPGPSLASSNVAAGAAAPEPPAQTSQSDLAPANGVRRLLDEMAAIPSQGVWLKSILARFANGALVWGTDATVCDGRVLLAFPSAFDGLGMTPSELRDLLTDSGWLVKDGASQQIMVNIETDGGSMRGCFTSDDLGPRFQELLRLKPDLIPAPGLSRAPTSPSIPEKIFSKDLGDSPTAVPPEVRLAFKRQVYSMLAGRRVTSKSSVKVVREALRAIGSELGFDSPRVMNDLLSQTPNPVLCQAIGEHEGTMALQINPEFKPKARG